MTHRHKIYTQGHLHPGTDITPTGRHENNTSLLTTEITASSYSTIHRSETLHTHLLCPPSVAEVSNRSISQRCVYCSPQFLSPRTQSHGANTVKDSNLSQSQLGSGAPAVTQAGAAAASPGTLFSSWVPNRDSGQTAS